MSLLALFDITHSGLWWLSAFSLVFELNLSITDCMIPHLFKSQQQFQCILDVLGPRRFFKNISRATTTEVNAKAKSFQLLGNVFCVLIYFENELISPLDKETLGSPLSLPSISHKRSE